MVEVCDNNPEDNRNTMFQKELKQLKNFKETKITSTAEWKNNKVLLGMVGNDHIRVTNTVEKLANIHNTLGKNNTYKLILKNYFDNNLQVLNAYLLTVMLQECDLIPRKGKRTGEPVGYFQLHRDANISTITNKWGLHSITDNDVLGVIKFMDDTSRLLYALDYSKDYKDKINLTAQEKRQVVFVSYSKGSIPLDAIKNQY